jgi:hemerythrin-like metal-binding protein
MEASAMSYMEWRPEMSVGMDPMDDDHKFLILVINRIAENLEKDGEDDALLECLSALRNYAAFHFAREEAVMRACGYETLVEHQDEHRKFTERMDDLARRIDDGTLKVREAVDAALLGYLRNWLFHHILVIDMSYSELVKDNEKAEAAAKGFKGSQLWWGAG